MDVSLAMATTYIFGPFRFDAAREILFRGTEPVALGQRAIALLRPFGAAGERRVANTRCRSDSRKVSFLGLVFRTPHERLGKPPSVPRDRTFCHQLAV
jgi:hypothetical protein